ncbi:MAG: hypothetical protein IPL33_15785 [Sphingobacteriales bacterium]|nr:hypothetical protein [Sphingobacteriales bacterium]
MSGATTYFWRVRGINGCGNGTYSAAFVFATGGNTCTNFVSSDVPKTISTSAVAPTVNSTVSISSYEQCYRCRCPEHTKARIAMGDLHLGYSAQVALNIILNDFSSLP